MLTDLIAQDAVVTIRLAQTTFAHIQTGDELYKLTYRHKAEALMKPGAQGLISLVQQHPMLLRYNEPCVTLYVGSKAANPIGLLHDIEQAVGTSLQGWRDWQSVLFWKDKKAAVQILLSNLRSGSGMLLNRAPLSIATAVLAVCEQHDFKTTFFGNLPEATDEPPHYQLLTIGPCYVIGQSFDCTQL